MTRTFIITLVSGLMALPVPALSQNDPLKPYGLYGDRDEYGRSYESPTFGSFDSSGSSNCYGYSCDKNKDKEREEKQYDQLQNSFSSSGGSPKGSLESIVNNQLQPR